MLRDLEHLSILGGDEDQSPQLRIHPVTLLISTKSLFLTFSITTINHLSAFPI
jgi:hypothetical protein